MILVIHSKAKPNISEEFRGRIIRFIYEEKYFIELLLGYLKSSSLLTKSNGF